MKYCTKLFEELNFEPASLQPCCNVRGIRTPNFPYSGGPIDMPAYVEHIQKISDELQSGGALCRGCPDLRTASGFAEFALSFKALSVNMHRFFCNCKCVYCSLWNTPGRKIPYSVLPGLQSLHAGGFLDEHCAISWGGGEPGILPEFEDAVHWAMQNFYWQYVHTNAIKFSPAITDLLTVGLGHINVSLDSGSPGTYRLVKGVDAWAKVAENLKNYAKYGNPEHITLKYIVFEANNRIGEIEKFLLFCGDLGVKTINFSLNFNETNEGAVSEKTILGAAYLKKRAKELGFDAAPFYLDQIWKDKIAAMEAAL